MNAQPGLSAFGRGRQIRLDHGLNRHDLKRWMRQRSDGHQGQDDEVLCYTPLASLWLLVPLIAESALLSAAKLLTGRMTLLSDSTLWRLVHTLMPKSERAFYLANAAETIVGASQPSKGLPSVGSGRLAMTLRLVSILPKLTAPKRYAIICKD
ncbi:MAG: hypothetical protein ACE5H6_02725 [Dehalococcoidia bacterium]